MYNLNGNLAFKIANWFDRWLAQIDDHWQSIEKAHWSANASRDAWSCTMDNENRVILNVGGIRHETYKVHIYIDHQIEHHYRSLVFFEIEQRVVHSRHLKFNLIVLKIVRFEFDVTISIHSLHIESFWSLHVGANNYYVVNTFTSI